MIQQPKGRLKKIHRTFGEFYERRLSKSVYKNSQSFLREEKVEEVWAATWQALGAPREDFKAVLQMAEMFSSAGQRMPAYFQFGRVQGTEEFPVVVLTYVGGQQKERSEVESVKQKTLNSSLFDLPKGLTKVEAERAPGS